MHGSRCCQHPLSLTHPSFARLLLVVPARPASHARNIATLQRLKPPSLHQLRPPDHQRYLHPHDQEATTTMGLLESPSKAGPSTGWTSMSDTVAKLSAQSAFADSEEAHAIVQTYVSSRLKSGMNKGHVSDQLDALERIVPKHRRTIRDIRSQYDMPQPPTDSISAISNAARRRPSNPPNPQQAAQQLPSPTTSPKKLPYLSPTTPTEPQAMGMLEVRGLAQRLQESETARRALETKMGEAEAERQELEERISELERRVEDAESLAATRELEKRLAEAEASTRIYDLEAAVAEAEERAERAERRWAGGAAVMA
ncbi:uncharacterized protein LOC62_05G007567 [Vanrija pseudolonga]|uniref:Uncharacterized protein n=1 Tax=Vanrija pseudolonga TaxID=143232 RepID=A0AAF1BPF8_9TREE|nr:hypothetical protein LOC62_05G007567 [Vanrija pseudolonga]